MYKIVPNLRNSQCTPNTNRWELRTDANEFIACFARKEVAEQVVAALEAMNEITHGLRAHVNPANYFTWYNPEREEKTFFFNGEVAAI